MDIIETVAALRQRLQNAHPVRFVPTMGNLHEGHLQLVERARALGGCVVTSLFVNPLQFGPQEDFERYPRTFAEDCAKLESVGCDLVFAPAVDELYPQAQQVFVEPPPLANELCGAMRPGHFRGVATVVMKLFGCVQPDTALFGKKDFQQLAVIRTLVRDLNLPVEIVGVECVRAIDGLALSSRNGYLSRSERAEAPRLQRILRRIADALAAGEADHAALSAAARSELEAHGWRVDYVAIRDPETLLPAAPGTPDWVVLAAAWLGNTRLIDNIDAEADKAASG